MFAVWDGDGVIIKQVELVRGTEPPRSVSENRELVSSISGESYQSAKSHPFGISDMRAELFHGGRDGSPGHPSKALDRKARVERDNAIL